MFTENLLHDLAQRIVSISTAMGLDDDDERLLWRYLVALRPEQRSTLGAAVIALLNDQGELKPLICRRWKAKASIDPIFVKPSEGIKALLPKKDLVYWEESPQPAICYDQEELRVAITQKVQMASFQKWYDRLQPVLREDGVNWNPPAPSDIVVELEVCFEAILPE